MAAIIIPRRSIVRPSGRVQLDHANPLSAGMTCAYLLSPDQWQIDLLSESLRATTIGAAPTFNNGCLRTSGNSSNYVRLKHGLGGSASGPISFVAGFERISGVVSWSLLSSPSVNWYGWYGEATGQVKTSQNNSFDGVVSTSGRVGVYTHSGSTLNGYGAVESTDTSATMPTAVTEDITLGGSMLNTLENPAVAEFDFLAVYSRILSAEESRDLVRNPWQLFRADPIRFYSLPSGPITLTSLTMSAFTSSGARATLGITR